MATEIDHKTASKYVLTIQYFVQPEKLSEFYTHLKRVLDIAHTIPGCIHSDVIESTMEPGKVTITEVWAADREEVGKVEQMKSETSGIVLCFTQGKGKLLTRYLIA